MKERIYSIEGKYYYYVDKGVCYEICGNMLEPVFKLSNIGKGLYRTQFMSRRVPNGIVRKATDIAEKYNENAQELSKDIVNEVMALCMTK